MATKESILQRKIMLAASRNGFTLFRNNVGKAWQGTKIGTTGARLTLGSGERLNLGPQDVLLRNARPINMGLHKGSSDLIGYRTVEIQPDMVGEEIAQFVAIEVKTTRGRVTPEQANFIDVVKTAGGLAMVARSEEDVANHKGTKN